MDRDRPGAALKLVTVKWSPRFEAGLSRVCTPQEILWHKREVDVGREHPVELSHGGSLLATALYRMEVGPDGNEMVFMGAFGFPLASPQRGVLNLMERFAAINDCKFLRFHTERPGLVRVALRAGYACPEFVMSKRVRP